MARLLIGEILVNNEIITPEQLNQALEIQKKTGGLLGIILVCQGVIKEETLIHYLDIQAKSD